MMKWRGVFVFAFAFVVSACSDDDGDKKPVYLVSADSFVAVSKSTIQLAVSAAGLDISPDEIKYDVEVFKVVYNTLYKGNMVQASGLIVMPKATAPVSMISLHHGTTTSNADAPSQTPTSDQTLFLYAALASPGFIVVIPDYLGFGASADIMHPYYVEEATASSILDNLRAANELAEQQDVEFNQRLYLAGYSQGGYVTMATHKAIEESGISGFELIASFPAAGGYDVEAMSEYLFAQDTYDQPHYLAYVARAYQLHYDWTQPLSEFFNEPYATRIPSLFDGSLSGSQINGQLTNDVSALVNNDLMQNINSNAEYAYIKNAFTENSLLDWTPTIPMVMYHGNADVTVPYENSVSSYSQLIANGASSSTVQFVTIEGADHGSGALPWIEDFVTRILAME